MTSEDSDHLPMQGQSDFAICSDKQACKLHFLERLQTSGLLHHSFSEGLNAFKPTAFLVHPVLAVVAEDAVATHSRPVLQIVIFVFPAFTLSLLHHCFSPSDMFLKRFNNDNKVIGIEVLPGDLRVELSWQGFKHNDEEQ